MFHVVKNETIAKKTDSDNFSFCLIFKPSKFSIDILILNHPEKYRFSPSTSIFVFASYLCRISTSGANYLIPDVKKYSTGFS